MTLDTSDRQEKIREVKTHDGWNRERDVKERYDHLIQIIKGKVADTTPKRKSQNNFGNGGHGTTGNREKQPACIWWNNECDKVTRIRKAKLLKWKYCKTEETFMEYKKAAVIAKNRLREIKQDYWKNFCDGLNQFTNPSYIWDRMKRLKYRFNKTDRERECKEELTNSAITTFGKLCSGVDEPNQAPAFDYENQDSFLDSEYTIQELLYSIKNLKVRSCPGRDGIDYAIIRNLPKEALEILLEIYNDILRARVFPDDWKKYRVFFIPKPDKTSVRPISLASCVCKVLERMINMRISWWLEKNMKFSESQYGFRRNKGCTDNLAILTTEIIKAFEERNTVSAVFLDIKSAYDNVHCGTLMDRLKAVGFSGNLIAFIFNLVSARELEANYGGVELKDWTYKGLPQGSVLSPTLYSLYMAGLKSKINQNCKILEYADDVAIYSVHRCSRIGVAEVEKSIQSIELYLKESGLEIAPKKCQLCIFDKKGTTEGEWEIKVQGEKVSSVKSIKFLGLHLKSNLDWEDEINAIVRKCENPMKIMNCVKHTWWGADPVILIRLYKALIRSRMEYGAFLFHKLKKKQAQKLEKIQYRAIRGALGYRSSTPTNVMLAEAKEVPIFSRFKQLGKNYVSRCYTSTNHPMIQLLEELSALHDNPGRGENELPVISKCYKEVSPLGHLIQSGNCPKAYDYTYESLFYEARVSFDEGRQIKETEDHNKEFYKIFQERIRTSKSFATDGSKMVDKPFVGLALIDINDGRRMKFRISKIASIFTAEAFAIAETLEIIEKTESGQNFTIFSDSASVLQSIGNPTKISNASHIIHMLKDKTERLESRGKKIQFYWIPGHCGVEINERVDSQAKLAIKEGRDSQLLLPVADLKTEWKMKGKEELHSFCQNTKQERGERYFERYYRKGSTPWFSQIKMNRRAFVSINRMRAGHTSLKGSLNRFNIVPTAECECGDGLQTEEHIFWDCKQCDDQRAIMMGILSENSKKHYPKSVTELLRLEEKRFLQGVCYFINNIPIYI
ncbi:hypothetical protein B7P43_G08428 [Cryptotermes secundus]|uniref:Reverse transcriptase domain-containing protein n=1 Tax=Cryptotermes secundus TaxID=105785 RepID=A0A2J7QNN8_9NEOP|nr:hypothetical protein B7P43_G08428 [Cryptotermes secundus]